MNKKSGEIYIIYYGIIFRIQIYILVIYLHIHLYLHIHVHVHTLQIESPSPDPLPFCNSPGLIWLNTLNSLDWSSWAMPTPSSRTLKDTRSGPRVLYEMVTVILLDSGQNLMAFETKLLSTCSKRNWSPYTSSGTLLSATRASVICLPNNWDLHDNRYHMNSYNNNKHTIRMILI